MIFFYHAVDILALYVIPEFADYICHHNDVIMSTMAPQITSLKIVYLTIYSGANQRKHQSSASLAFVMEIHWLLVNTLHKGPPKNVSIL